MCRRHVLRVRRRGDDLALHQPVTVGNRLPSDAVLDFSDALTFAMALANIFGLYALAPVVKAELESYWARMHPE